MIYQRFLEQKFSGGFHTHKTIGFFNLGKESTLHCWAGIGIFVLELLRYKGFRAEAKSNKGFRKGWEAEYLAKNKGF